MSAIIITIIAINITSVSNKKDKSKFSIELFGNAIAQTSGGSGNGSGVPSIGSTWYERCDCSVWEWLWHYKRCNEKKQVAIVSCGFQTTLYTWQTSHANGTVTINGRGYVNVNGSITMTYGSATGSRSESTGTISFPGTLVSCPTNGSGNTCEEYNPCNI